MTTGYEAKAFQDLSRLAKAAERIATSLEAMAKQHLHHLSCAACSDGDHVWAGGYCACCGSREQHQTPTTTPQES